MDSFFTIEGWWNARREDSDNLARRLADFFLRLAELQPLFNDWTRGGMRHRSTVPRDFTAPGDHVELRQWLEENPRYKASDGRKTLAGYRLFADAATRADDPNVGFWLGLDAAKSRGFLDGDAHITIFYPPGVDQLKLQDIARPMLLALAQTWDATWAGVQADDYCVTGGPPRRRPLPRYRGGQMIYLSAEKARGLSLPPDVEAENLSDGSLLVIATDMPFDRRNALHRDAAARIQVALDPLNGY